MKKFLMFLFVLMFALAACAPAQPAAPAAAPQVVVVTVEVPAGSAPTQPPAPTAVPPTDVPAATAVPATEAPTVAAEIPTATAQPAVGADLFTDFTRSADSLSLKCGGMPSITFSLRAINNYVKEVDFYYHTVDKQTGAASPWKKGPNGMQKGDNNVFTLTFSALDIDPDLRYEKAWLEYQFVGLNKKDGDAVGRTPKEMFQQQVTFTLDCP